MTGFWSPVLFRAAKRIWKIARKVGRSGVSAVVVACCRGIVVFCMAMAELWRAPGFSGVIRDTPGDFSASLIRISRQI